MSEMKKVEDAPQLSPLEQYVQAKIQEAAQEEQAIKQMEFQLVARKGGLDRLRHTILELQSALNDGKQETEAEAAASASGPAAAAKRGKKGE